MTFTKFEYFNRADGKGWSNVESLLIFLNMDLTNPIGNCELIVKRDDFTNHLIFFGKIEWDREMDPELYFYYLRDTGQARTFFLKGFNLSEKKVSAQYANKFLRYTDPYKIVISRPFYQLKHILINEIPGGYNDRQATIIPMF